MNDDKDQTETKGRLSLRPSGRGELGRTVDIGSVRQSFSHGRSKVVQVEVRKKRGPGAAPATPEGASRPAPKPAGGSPAPRALTATEQAARQRAVAEQARETARREAELREQEKISILSAAEEARRREDEDAKRALEDAVRKADEERAEREAAAAAAEVDAQTDTQPEQPAVSMPTPGSMDSHHAVARQEGLGQGNGRQPEIRPADGRQGDGRQGDGRQGDQRNPATRQEAPTSPPRRPAPAAASPAPETLRLKPARPGGREEEEERSAPRRAGGPAGALRKAPAPAPKKQVDDRRRGGARIDVQAAVEGDDERVRSLASVRRQRDRERRQAELEMLRSDQVRVVRDVILPDTITVQELANRMAARVGDLIKSLMKLGVMATVTQSIDADTAELVINEFGHKARRVSEADVESGLEGETDAPETLMIRPPVVTIMGHVDHGKTSLLDALRHADVAAREAGGITQHIGAYQVTLDSGSKITFIDTPGHEAFTAMRARGAGVTDIVILVVAADDGVMPQTIEAIRHAKAASAPIIVAINKMDKADANPDRVRNELLQYDIVVEQMGGETQDVEVSATKRTGLDNLLEAVLLQAEILDLRANPDRAAEGAVIESRLDRGRGPVATVLVQKGSLHQGDIVVAGAEWGRVRAMLDDKSKPITDAGPSMPAEILGLSAVPSAGEAFVVVENESRAREVAEFRQRRERDRSSAATGAGRGTMDQMIARIQAGEQKEVAVVIKADVQGSTEAIQATVEKVGNDEVRVRALTASVGQITESDVQLAKASDAIVIGFNVRATAQARDLARRDNVDIRYYSIIYEVADDIEKIVKGKLAPVHREKFLGYAEIRQVFNITKVGKVAGCYVTEGLVKRGAGIRLLRDNVVIHQGPLSQLKRFKDDVREVARGYECGLSFAGFNDLKEGDVVECYETEIVPA